MWAFCVVIDLCDSNGGAPVRISAAAVLQNPSSAPLIGDYESNGAEFGRKVQQECME